jgi:hypothetical protein
MGGRPDSLYDFICVICSQTFDHIPLDALEVSRSLGSRITLWDFPEGSQHSLKKRRKKAAKAAEEN